LTHVNNAGARDGILHHLSHPEMEESMAIKHRIVVSIVAALGAAALIVSATAQPYGPGGTFMGPGMMGGPGMGGGWMMSRRGGMCGPAAAGFAEWRADRLAELVQLTDAQRAKFDEFKAVSVKSAEAMRAACRAETPTTIVGRAEAMEKRMDAMLQTIREVRPSLEAFYATLTDEQKAKLDSGFDRGRFWHWREHW
jgi:Spy/CpxP family protein refolding chaperone